MDGGAWWAIVHGVAKSRKRLSVLTNFLYDVLVGSPCCPRDSQDSSTIPQFKSINSLALSFLYGPTLTYMTTGKTLTLTRWTFVGKVMPLLFNMLSAAAAKSLQSCPTLCDPTDGSPPGSPIPGILQARALEWVAMSFSNA